MIIGETGLNNESKGTPDIVLGRKDEDSCVVKRMLATNILSSKNISDVYNTYSSSEIYVSNVAFDDKTNTFTFTYSDGDKLIAKVESDGSVDLSGYATLEEVDEKINSVKSNLQWKESVSTYDEIMIKYPNPKDGWTVNVNDTDITYRYTGDKWISISANAIPLATHEVDGKMSSSDKIKLDGLSNYNDSKIYEELNKKPSYSEFGEGRKTIQLRNYDSISGITTKGTGVNMVMVSKWDKVDLGSPQVEINLNGSAEHPTYNDAEQLAFVKDVENAVSDKVTSQELQAAKEELSQNFNTAIQGEKERAEAAEGSLKNSIDSLGVYSIGKVGSFYDIPDKLAQKDICTNASNVVLTFVVSNTVSGDEGGYCTNIYTQKKVYQTLYWKNTVSSRTLIVTEAGEVQTAEFKPSGEDQVFLLNRAISGPKFFALTTESTPDEIKAAMTGVISKQLITSEDLDRCYVYGFLIKEEVMNGSVMVGWNGSAYTFTQVGFSSPSSEPVLRWIVIKVTPEGSYSVIRNGSSSKILTEVNSSSKFELKVDKVSGKSLVLDSDAAMIPILMNKLSMLEDKVSSLGKTNVESSTISGTSESQYNDSSKDYVITGEVNSGEKLNISGKSVSLKDFSISNGSRLKIESEADSYINSVNISGDFPKSNGNTILSINKSNDVVIKNGVINSTSYNVIEIGLSGDSLPNSVDISNCNFTGSSTNNAILIFGTADNAIINISNCHFSNVSNVLRISNKSNSKCTINIVNCSCDKWESNLEYTGMIICQDYTSSNPSTENLFSPDKITINISNFRLPNGNILKSPEDISTICGSGTSDQIIYVYTDTEGLIKYNDGSRYPKLNIL